VPGVAQAAEERASLGELLGASALGESPLMTTRSGFSS
jgi:hypothetical protein